jgi:t-SNARE complex subunit (syntaxin)
MEQLELSITNLKKINNLILGSVSNKEIKNLEKERENIISIINNQCKILNPILFKDQYEQFNNLIKKYLTIQKHYRDTERQILTTQLILKDPSLTVGMADNIITNGQCPKNILQLSHANVNANEMYNFVKQRHEQVLKLEKSIQEVNELFIGMYAIIEEQGETVDRIKNKTESAKNNTGYAVHDLRNALKYAK